ncbi:hypothetical protein [Cellulomonas sp. PhB143]|uniref:hypothetical protein n=1 Tax=Cellulomonas sp. PhB143 TaxID=2485186 RepID=UPI000F477519|nr:hypothetical protein [Cellulomonas sp. PhB143]ROS75367.1 hypothetical protein EDF32_1776 [Cellulomonas sp. PhB143]
MSPRRGGSGGGTVVLDLSDLPDDGGGGGSGGDLPGEGAAPGPRPRHRRALLAAVGGAVVVAVALGTVSVVAAHRDEARLVSAAGGLRPLDDAPGRTWSLPVSGDAGVVHRDGTVVLTGAGTDGSEDSGIEAVDAATGAVRWRVPVGGSATCDDGIGPGGDAGDAAGSGWPMTCVGLDGDTATVTLVGEDGTVVGHREEDVTGDRPLLPIAGGALVTAVRVGDPPEGGEGFAYDLDGAEPSELPPGRDVRVTVTDAATGAERWSRTLRYAEPDDPWRCVVWTDDDPVGDVAVTDLWVSGGVVQVSGCGVDAQLTPDGVRLDDPAVDDSVQPLGDGTFLREATNVTSGVVTAQEVLDGGARVLWEVPGTLLVPLASDGTGAETRLVLGDGRLTGYGPDHRARWRSPVAADAVLVQTADVAVVAAALRLVAVDLATGETRWTRELQEPVDGYQAFTDGSSAIVTTTLMGRPLDGGAGDGAPVDVDSGEVTGPSGVRVDAYDLADGAERWTVTEPPDRNLVAVAGSLLAVDGRSVSRLG